ncbi:MAG TPA: sialidase family protein, partial [Actinomycetota bacterium]|nr:sialidase family protein [Actinomycetota bacterium]
MPPPDRPDPPTDAEPPSGPQLHPSPEQPAGRRPAQPPRPDRFEEPPAFHPHWLPPPPHPPRPPRYPRAKPVAARAWRWGAGALVVAFVAVAFVGDAPQTRVDHDVLITDDHSGATYVREDGQPNAITDLCGSSRQPQNEPSVAVDPHDPRVVAVGSNDACGSRFGSHWAGFYRSDDGGSTWSRSLVPGFVQDTSDDGVRSPVHHRCDLAGDPALSFDRGGTLFYGFVCVGQRNPLPGAIYVSRYADDGVRYVGTVPVPSSNANGFEDKPTLAVDTTGRQHDGAVYTAWTDFTTTKGRVEACEGVLFSRSTNGGRTFERSKLISGPVCAEFADIAVGPFGGVYVTFRSAGKVWITGSFD